MTVSNHWHKRIQEQNQATDATEHWSIDAEVDVGALASEPWIDTDLSVLTRGEYEVYTSVKFEGFSVQDLARNSPDDEDEIRALLRSAERKVGDEA